MVKIVSIFVLKDSIRFSYDGFTLPGSGGGGGIILPLPLPWYLENDQTLVGLKSSRT